MQLSPIQRILRRKMRVHSTPLLHKPAGGLFEKYDTNNHDFLSSAEDRSRAEQEIWENDRQTVDHHP
jgi:hypothetical protein